jgi:hypothetical protein
MIVVVVVESRRRWVEPRRYSRVCVDSCHPRERTPFVPFEAQYTEDEGMDGDEAEEEPGATWDASQQAVTVDDYSLPVMTVGSPLPTLTFELLLDVVVVEVDYSAALAVGGPSTLPPKHAWQTLRREHPSFCVACQSTFATRHGSRSPCTCISRSTGHLLGNTTSRQNTENVSKALV